MGKFKLYALFLALAVLCTASHAAYAGGDSRESQSTSPYIFKPNLKDHSSSGMIDFTVKMYTADNVYMGYSQSFYLLANQKIYLMLIKIVSGQRGKGAGSALFKETMEQLKEAFPDNSEVSWKISPLEVTKDDPSYPTALEALKAFYKKQGALVMQSPWSKYSTGLFYLKK